MARNTKPLSGGAKDKFLRGLVEAVAGVPEDVARTVTRELTASITEVRARREVYERIRDGQPATAPTEKPRAVPARQIAPKLPEPAVVAFDPFAFSAIAVLTKKGRLGLAAELAVITSVEHLRRLAEAQHLALDPAIVDVDQMRTAIVAGAERRMAERKAAAS